MIRVVADTNVYVSALMFGGVPGTFLDLAFLESFTLIASTALLDEFQHSQSNAAVFRFLFKTIEKPQGQTTDLALQGRNFLFF